LDTQKPASDLIAHFVEPNKNLKVGEEIELLVDKDHREPTKRHHTATHLLHAALRKILGKNVTQAGSLVEPNRLRFDYTYNKPLTPQQIQEIEDMVNFAILQNWDVTPKVFPSEQAKKMGAMALFGEKYGDQVRCLLISAKGYENFAESFSLELCGGTHVSATGDIGGFKITSDTSLAAGVRRMEAITGFKTIEYLRSLEGTIKGLSEKLKTPPDQLGSRISRLMERQNQLEQELRDMKIKLAQGGTAQSNLEIQKINGISLAVRVNEGLNVDELRLLADRLKQQLKSGVVFVATTTEDEGKVKVSFIFTLTPDLKDKYNAGLWAKKAAQELGGSGGGRPDFAQGGGQGREKLNDLIKKLPELLK